ncbi:tyrosine-type recombinase/integrase [Niallia sp. FSL W8-0951]|uniref:tyrosine-type recombinase/integrase n=1 Tax=Niallia sp. FSL W8-0951 TaxID=2954639 RepID=UPI0030F58F45
MGKRVEKIKEVTEEEWEACHPFNKRITNEFLEQQHLSPQTLRQYQSSLKIFFRWVKDNCENKSITDLKPRDALRYQNFLMSRDLSSNAVKFKRSSVSSLCGFIELYYNEDYPLFRNIYNKKIPNPPRALRNEKQPLTKEELDLLVDTLKEREEWQMVAYVMFSYESGCRRSETAQLLKEVVTYDKVKDKDGNFKDYYMTNSIRCKGKGREGNVRKLVMGDAAMEAVKKWLEVRGEDDCDLVFVKKTKDGKVDPLSPTAFNYWCHEIFSEIVGRRVHPHQLRSTRATHIVAIDGKDIKTAQKVLGHKSSETTQIYVIRDDDDDIDDAF